MQRPLQHPLKKLNAGTRSLSLNAIQPLCQVTSFKTSENEEPVYAMVSKAQPKSTSPTDPQTHWQNLKQAVYQFGPPHDSRTADTDTSQTHFVAPGEDGANYEAVTGEDWTDLLSYSIQQLAINDALENISAEAIYADPQDLGPGAESDDDAVYDEPEEVIKSNQRAQDGERSAECDFFYIPEDLSTHVMAARSSPSQSLDDISSEYDNLMLKGRRM